MLENVSKCIKSFILFSDLYSQPKFKNLGCDRPEPKILKTMGTTTK